MTRRRQASRASARCAVDAGVNPLSLSYYSNNNGIQREVVASTRTRADVAIYKVFPREEKNVLLLRSTRSAREHHEFLSLDVVLSQIFPRDVSHDQITELQISK